MHTSWKVALASEFKAPYFKELADFVTEERKKHPVYPPPGDVFNALDVTPYDKTTVLLLGQDPYHGFGQAHGLSFSVLPGVRPPPSLANIFKELADDVGFRTPRHGCLLPWAKQGVLLLNTVLTVKATEPGSHKGRGWETFTDAVIKKLAEREAPLVFVLWGSQARAKTSLIDTTRHVVITSAHPSPMSAYNGFFGSKPFSKINVALEKMGHPPIDWQLPTTMALDGQQQQVVSP